MLKWDYQPGQQYLVRSDGGDGWGLDDGGGDVVIGLHGGAVS